MRLPVACVFSRVATVLTRLSLACCESETPELGLHATLTLHKQTCLLVLCQVNGGVGLRPAEDPRRCSGAPGGCLT